MATYVAFLMGINVGGSRKVPMAELRALLLELGFRSPQTLLASGNAIFETELGREEATLVLEAGIHERFGFPVGTILWTAQELVSLYDLDPFAGLSLPAWHHCYVTFADSALESLEQLRAMTCAGFQFVSAASGAVFSVQDRDVAPNADFMTALRRSLTGKITTRNWNTIEKLVARLR